MPVATRKPMRPLKAPLPRRAPVPLEELQVAEEEHSQYVPAASAAARWWTNLLLSANSHEDERYREAFAKAFQESLRAIIVREMSLSRGTTVVMTHNHPGFALTEAIERAGGTGMFAWKLPMFVITIVREDGVIEQGEDGKMTPIWGKLASEVSHA